MRTRVGFIVRILVALAVAAVVSCKQAEPQLVGLTVEYVETPLGVDTQKPRFGWRMHSEGNIRGLQQVAYQVEVWDETGNAVWNSGKVESGISQNVEYAGRNLLPTTRYTWKVKAWDNRGREQEEQSWFETSLFSSDDKEGWNGAEWIGGSDDDMVLYSHYLPVFKLNLSFCMSQEAKQGKIGFVYGGNDERLMDRNKNIFHLENVQDESYVKVEFDLSPVKSGGEALLLVFRVGYDPADRADQPISSFKIPKTIVHQGNVCDRHCFTLYSNLGFTRFYHGEELLGEINLNPLGRGGDYIAFPVVGDVGYWLASEPECWDARMEICNFRSPENLLAEVEMDKDRLKREGESMYFVNPSRNSMPMLRTTFLAKDKRIAKARLYATARGIYEMYLNGHRIGDDYFNPGVTQYNKTHLYQIYDVTALISKQENALGALLAEGWWSGGTTYTGENWNYFGDRQSLLAQLVITYEDGEKQVIITSPDSWTYFNDGPVVYGSFFQGEVYDASKENEINGWATVSYDDSSWKRAVEVTLDGHVSRTAGFNQLPVDDYSAYSLIAQYGQTIKAIKRLTAQSVEEVRPGVFVYDMGQNMVGVPEISLAGLEPGKRINVRYAEVKYPDLPRYAGNQGMVMLENIRAAMAQDIYITKGGKEMISPRFTYHGYRYLEITGIDEALPVEDVRGIVLSSVDGLASYYESSNEKVNKLWHNIVWSTYANFFSIPTDCPQRNERLGWAGDISVFSRTATYLADVPQFLRRYLRAMRDVQREDGRFPDVAPLGGGFGGLLWGSAGITIPWEVYQQYGDKVLLAEHYQAMCRYIDYVLEKNIDPKTGIIVQEHVYGNLGDWLGPEDNKNDKTLMWEAYFLYDLEIMSKVAALLGKAEDVERYDALYAERLDFFRKTYVDGATAKTISSGMNGPQKGESVDIQTSYVLPLSFGLIADTMKVRFAANFANSVARSNIADDGKRCPPYSLMTGFIGTAWINKALSDNGYDDVAYKLLQQTEYPSWLYPVEQGATTIWERLNSYTHVDGFGKNNRMNSFNHYSFGAVGAWLYGYSLGIMRDEDVPGFKHFILAPRVDPTGKMVSAKGYYDSLYGRIESSWSISDDKVSYSFVIPANTSATLRLHAESLSRVKEGGLPVDVVEGISFIRCEDGVVELEIGSGKYEFVVY